MYKYNGYELNGHVIGMIMSHLKGLDRDKCVNVRYTINNIDKITKYLERYDQGRPTYYTVHIKDDGNVFIRMRNPSYKTKSIFIPKRRDYLIITDLLPYDKLVNSYNSQTLVEISMDKM